MQGHSQHRGCSCSTYLVMKIHHEWVLVGRVSGRVQHSWRCAGESVGAGLIYRDVRLLGEGRVQLGVILAQQGCQRSVASSPLTPGRGAAGPPQERNRAGVTPGQGQCPALQCSGLSPSSGCQPPAPLALCVPLCVLSTGPPPHASPGHAPHPELPQSSRCWWLPQRAVQPTVRPHTGTTATGTPCCPIPSPEVVRAAAGSP